MALNQKLHDNFVQHLHRRSPQSQQGIGVASFPLSLPREATCRNSVARRREQQSITAMSPCTGDSSGKGGAHTRPRWLEDHDIRLQDPSAAWHVDRLGNDITAGEFPSFTPAQNHAEMRGWIHQPIASCRTRELPCRRRQSGRKTPGRRDLQASG